MKKFIIYAFIVGMGFLLASLFQKDYKIINEVVTERYNRCVLTLRLEKELNKEELAEIAAEIKEDKKSFDKVYISFYLPNQEVGEGAYATAKFEPEPVITIQGWSK
jgi:3-dehydroquinate synthetase